MSGRTIQVVVRRNVTYERKVIIQVVETSERSKDDKDPHWGGDIAFIAAAEDAAIEKAEAGTLTGWSTWTLATKRRPPSGGMVDVAI